MKFESLGDDLRCAVIGSSGGIGAALIEQLVQSSQVARIHALSRSGRSHPSPKVANLTFDFTEEDSLIAAAQALQEVGPFDPLLRRDEKAVFAALSARVGSISDNRLGGWYAYRASKAALNMVLKTLAIEIGRRFKNQIIVGLHPGTVDTDLSKPFQGNVPEGKLFTAEWAGQQVTF